MLAESLVRVGLRLRGRFIFPLLAFTIPLMLRAVPEVLMSPYVAGFDTMGHYVPTAILWLNSGVNLWSYIGTGPLFYTLIVSLVISGGPLIAVLKIVPPILHGFLGLSVYAFAKKGLDWSPRKSTMVALVATAYFVALRISWDLLRNELALVLLFAVLTLLTLEDKGKHSWKRFLLLSFATAAVVLAHQLVAVILVGLVAFTVIHKFIRKATIKALRLILAFLPALLLFVLIFCFSPAVPEFRVIFGFPQSTDGWLQLFGFPSYQAMITSEAGFFLYCFLPLLPLAILSIRRFGNFQMRSWIVLIFIASLIPMASPSNLRWEIMLVYPLAFYATDGLSRLKSFTWKRFKVTVQRVAVVYLVLSTAVLSLGFLLMPPEAPFAYFDAGKCNAYIYQIPSSMLQNTVSIADCKETADALQWFKDNSPGSALLLTHRAFYGWALSTLNMDRVVLYEYDDPANAAETQANQGNSQIYLIWWINGTGWYGQPTVPSSFNEVHRNGQMAIYNYIPNNVTQR